jgi:hypothetical protein
MFFAIPNFISLPFQLILEIIENQVFNLYENVEFNYDELKNNEFSSLKNFNKYQRKIRR